MQVTSERDGVQFSWGGRHSRQVTVYRKAAIIGGLSADDWFTGVFERFSKEGIVVDWQASRYTRVTGGGEDSRATPRGAHWGGVFSSWEQAALAFSVLLKVVGFDEDGHSVDISVEAMKGGGR